MNVTIHIETNRAGMTTAYLRIGNLRKLRAVSTYTPEAVADIRNRTPEVLAEEAINHGAWWEPYKVAIHAAIRAEA